MNKINPDNVLFFEDGEKQRRIEEMKTFEFRPTRFAFLNDHYGLRRGVRHVLMGTSGTGKSTLTRSILGDITANHKTLLYSSEESFEQTKDMFALRNAENASLANLSFLHEDEMLDACKGDPKNLEEFARVLSVRITNSNAQCLFFDNITTSDFYNGQEYGQAVLFLSKLNKVIKEFNIPIFIVAHTKKGIKDDQQCLIGPDDVKGFSTLTDKCEYLYIYQKFTGSSGATTTPTYGTIRVRKGRGLSNIDSTYLLDYDFDKREYFGDVKISFNKFNEIYTNRIRLGQK